jgi:prepilin-type N-terminal cleavage/methylation domain-containing protein
MKWSGTSSLLRRRRRHLPARGQKGFVLIEVLVSMAIFGVISVGFLSALVAGYHGVVVAHDQTMAQSLTRTTFENVRMAAYPVDTGADSVTPASKFDVVVHADYINKDHEIVTDPTDLQLITVTIRYHESGRTAWVTEGMKVKPG